MTGILAAILARQAVRPTLVCAGWQIARAREWSTWPAIERTGVEVVDGITEPGVRWSLDPAVYADGRLTGWADRLARMDAIRRADVVWSDNLVGVLATRPDAVLSGSFLWSDVLATAYPHDPAVGSFVKRERALLDAHRPPMLGLEALAMPGVRQRTTAVLLPWMVERAPSPTPTPAPVEPAARRATRRRVAVLGGATGALDNQLRDAADALLADPSIEVAVSPRWEFQPADDTSADRVVPFGFDKRAYVACDAVVCRPGVGTLTDCIAAGVPMLLVYEPGNAELIHNARCVAAAGMAFDLGTQLAIEGPQTIVDAVRAVLDPARTAAMRQAIAAQPTTGLADAADWLISHRLS